MLFKESICAGTEMCFAALVLSPFAQGVVSNLPASWSHVCSGGWMMQIPVWPQLLQHNRMVISLCSHMDVKSAWSLHMETI